MSYISSLNLLGDDSPVPMSEEALSEELAIWANAQFTFDTKPGSAILDNKEQDLFFGLNTTQNDTLLNTYLNNTSYLIPSQPILPKIAPAPTTTTTTAPTPTTTPTTTTTTTTTPISSKKRKSVSISSRPEITNEEPVELAEEDKRKRNTAASARFRMKKKLREQALEQTAKEMTAKAEALEKRVIELEKEAKWLRALVVEKDPALLS